MATTRQQPWSRLQITAAVVILAEFTLPSSGAAVKHLETACQGWQQGGREAFDWFFPFRPHRSNLPVFTGLQQ